jgi:hypothetical protein
MTTFSTKDFYLSAYLISSGLPLQAHSRTGSVSTFTFSETPGLHSLVDEYFGFRALVNPVVYANAFRNLKSVIYSNTTTNVNTTHNSSKAK